MDVDARTKGRKGDLKAAWTRVVRWTPLSSSAFGYVKIDEVGNYVLDVESNTTNINGTSLVTHMENFNPILEITQGKHLFNPTQGSNNAVELYYRISVMEEGKSKGFFGIGSDGKIHTSMEIVTYKSSVEEAK